MFEEGERVIYTASTPDAFTGKKGVVLEANRYGGDWVYVDFDEPIETSWRTATDWRTHSNNLEHEEQISIESLFEGGDT